MVLKQNTVSWSDLGNFRTKFGGPAYSVVSELICNLYAWLVPAACKLRPLFNLSCTPELSPVVFLVDVLFVLEIVSFYAV